MGRLRKLQKRANELDIYNQGNISSPIEELPLHLLQIQRAMIYDYVVEEYGEETEETFRAYCKKHNLIDFTDIQNHVAKKIGIAIEE